MTPVEIARLPTAELSAWVRMMRRKLGLTQAQLAASFDEPVATHTVGRWECGMRRPDWRVIRDIEALVSEIDTTAASPRSPGQADAAPTGRPGT